MYINKQTTVKAGFNPNSIKSFINVKTTFKNIFHNLINIGMCVGFGRYHFGCCQIFKENYGQELNQKHVDNLKNCIFSTLYV